MRFGFRSVLLRRIALGSTVAAYVAGCTHLLASNLLLAVLGGAAVGLLAKDAAVIRAKAWIPDRARLRLACPE